MLPITDVAPARDAGPQRGQMPEHEASQLERLEAKRDGDDEQAHDDAGYDIKQCHPEPAEDKPDDVEQKSHNAHPSAAVVPAWRHPGAGIDARYRLLGDDRTARSRS